MSERRSAPDDCTGELARGIRDGLLQDLLAVSMLIEGARSGAGERDVAATRRLLAEAKTTLRGDVAAVRALITRLLALEARCRRAPTTRARTG